MKTREEVARFIEHQFKVGQPYGYGWHYGKGSLRQLMDFMFDGPPACETEELFESLRL